MPLVYSDIQDSVAFNMLLEHSTVWIISTSTKMCAEQTVGLFVPTAAFSLKTKRRANLKQRLVMSEKNTKATVAQRKAVDDATSIVAAQQDANEFDSSYTEDAGDDADEVVTQTVRAIPMTTATTKQNLSTMDESRDHEKVAAQKIHALERKVAFLLSFPGIGDLPHDDEVEVQDEQIGRAHV